jgi:hypothetical protein
LDSEGQVHEISNRDKDSTGSKMRDHSCYILAKKLFAFCLCPEKLWHIEFKYDRLIKMVEEISRYSSIWAASWLLLIAFTYVECKFGTERLKNLAVGQKLLCKLWG